jgi:hypothetical protein
VKTSLGDDSYLASFYVETEAGELGMSGPHRFEVVVNLRALAAIYRRALRSVALRATAEGNAIVVEVQDRRSP